MGDDLTPTGIPIDDAASDEKEFDPDALESDDFIDDFIEDDLVSEELGVSDEEEVDPFDSEDE